MNENIKEAVVDGELEIGEFGSEAINCLMGAGPEISRQCMPSVIAEVSMQILDDLAKNDPEGVVELLKAYEDEVNEALPEYVGCGLDDPHAIGAAMATVVASDLFVHLPNIMCIVALRMAARLGYEEVPIDILFQIHAVTQLADENMTLDELRNSITDLIVDDDTEMADEARISRMS